MSNIQNGGPSRHSFSVEGRGEFDDLLKLLDDLFALRESVDNRKLWYRGHTRARYELRPSIGREEEYLGQPKVRYVDMTSTCQPPPLTGHGGLPAHGERRSL